MANLAFNDRLENFRQAFINQFADALRTPADAEQYLHTEDLIRTHIPLAG